VKAGEELISKLESCEIKLKEGETIKIVGHSQGAAYAAGIATALARSSKYGSLLELIICHLINQGLLNIRRA
jgi:predicted esterase